MDTEKSTSELQNLYIYEIVNNNLNLPNHIVECLKNTSGDVDIECTKQLKKALLNANLADIFNDRRFILNGSKHVLLDTSNINENQSHAIFTKNKKNNCSLLNYFSSSFNDIDLTSTYEEIKLITNALSGVYARTEQQKELEQINLEKQVEEINIDLQRLGRYLHWQICDEYSLRSRAEFSSLSPMITGAVLLKTYVLTDILQCNGSCGKVFTSSEESSNTACECGGEILLAPPMLKVENISFVVPEQIESMIPDQEESSPMSFFNLINKSFLNRKLLLILNQLDEFKMKNKISIPSDAVFQYEDTNDIIRIHFTHEVKDNKEVIIFACITDTRHSDTNFLSSVSLPVIMRDIKNGLKGDFNWEQIITKSELRDWKVTPFIKGKELEKITSYKDIDSLFTGEMKDV
ncbi:MAG: hypothetical protein GOP50_09185 [Candidatus Heimdallarchaeota archaeon]|nr:hypothetical protein [Candidatus Heimdallarchaeota archaeon]